MVGYTTSTKLLANVIFMKEWKPQTALISKCILMDFIDNKVNTEIDSYSKNCINMNLLESNRKFIFLSSFI